MRRPIYIMIGIVAVLAIAFTFFFFRKNSNVATGNVPQFPAKGGLPEMIGPGLSRNPSGDTFFIGTSRGGVEVKNFYNNVLDVEEGSLILRDTTSYTIGYNTLNSIFKIVIFAGPLGTVRAQAEDDLLGLLAVTKEQACRLTVKIVIYAGVDKNTAEQSYPLSFCAGAPAPQ